MCATWCGGCMLGGVVFHEGDGEVAVRRHGAPHGRAFARACRWCGCSTARGWLVLASDAAHYHENWLTGARPFRSWSTWRTCWAGFATLGRLASSPAQVVPGARSDRVRKMFPAVGDDVYRLDVEPLAQLSTRNGESSHDALPSPPHFRAGARDVPRLRPPILRGGGALRTARHGARKGRVSREVWAAAGRSGPVLPCGPTSAMAARALDDFRFDQILCEELVGESRASS